MTTRREALAALTVTLGARPLAAPPQTARAIEQPTRFALIANVRTARTLGLTIPQSLVLRANEVIQ